MFPVSGSVVVVVGPVVDVVVVDVAGGGVVTVVNADLSARKGNLCCIAPE